MAFKQSDYNLKEVLKKVNPNYTQEDYAAAANNPEVQRKYRHQFYEQWQANQQSNNDVVGNDVVDNKSVYRYEPMANPYEGLDTTAPTAQEEADIYEQERKRMQAQIDAISAAYQPLFAQEQQYGQERLGQQRAMAARGGLIGSSIGAAQKTKTEQFNTQQMKSLQAERDTKIQAIFAKADDRAAEEIRYQRDVSRQNYDKYMDWKRETLQEARGDFKELIKTGNIDLDKFSDEDLQMWSDQTGWSPFEMNAWADAFKPKEEQIDWQYRWRGDNLVAFGQDPVTEELKTKTYTSEELGIPEEEKPVDPAFINNDLTGEMFFYDKSNPELDESGNLIMKSLGKYGESLEEQRAYEEALTAKEHQLRLGEIYAGKTAKDKYSEPFQIEEGGDWYQKNLTTGEIENVGESVSAEGDKDLSSSQYVAAGYADRIGQANHIIESVGSQFTGTGSYVGQYLPNILKSDDRQKFEQAERNFINATLRRESGAAIAESEFKSARKQYIPQPGDSQAVLNQKRMNRETIYKNMSNEAGGAFQSSSDNDPLGLF